MFVNVASSFLMKHAKTFDFEHNWKVVILSVLLFHGFSCACVNVSSFSSLCNSTSIEEEEVQ